MKIEIPEGFFPPPGVPFETSIQLDLAVSLHRSGLLKLQLEIIRSMWIDATPEGLNGSAHPHHYRLAPPKPSTVGPFEACAVYSNDKMNDGFDKSAWDIALSEARKLGMKNYRIKLTATAEEIL